VSYDRRLSDAKQAVITMLCNLQDPNTKFTHMDLARTIEDLNKAWDELTDALVRQRDERGAEVLRLLDQLAESKRIR
jgi:hypothetical protein